VHTAMVPDTGPGSATGTAPGRVAVVAAGGGEPDGIGPVGVDHVDLGVVGGGGDGLGVALGLEGDAGAVGRPGRVLLVAGAAGGAVGQAPGIRAVGGGHPQVPGAVGQLEGVGDAGAVGRPGRVGLLALADDEGHRVAA